MLAAMQLTRFTDLGLRVLMYVSVSAPGEVVTIAEIGQRFDAAPNHLTKVVVALGRDGFVETVRGRMGGMRLARPADGISVGEVVRRTEEGFQLNGLPALILFALIIAYFIVFNRFLGGTIWKRILKAQR